MSSPGLGGGYESYEVGLLPLRSRLLSLQSRLQSFEVGYFVVTGRANNTAAPPRALYLFNGNVSSSVNTPHRGTDRTDCIHIELGNAAAFDGRVVGRDAASGRVGGRASAV